MRDAKTGKGLRRSPLAQQLAEARRTGEWTRVVTDPAACTAGPLWKDASDDGNAGTDAKAEGDRS